MQSVDTLHDHNGCIVIVRPSHQLRMRRNVRIYDVPLIIGSCVSRKHESRSERRGTRGNTGGPFASLILVENLRTKHGIFTSYIITAIS